MRQRVICTVAAFAALLLVGSAHASVMGYWHFDEGTGQTVADSSANGNDGTMGSLDTVQTEDPAWGTSSEAKVGNSCIICNHNEKDWVSVPDSDSLDVGGADVKIHCQAWIFPVLVGSDAVDYPVQIILWKGSVSSSGVCNYSLDMHTTGGNTFIRFGFRDSAAVPIWQYMDSPAASIPDGGLWYLVSADYDSTQLGENNCRISITYRDASNVLHVSNTIGTIFLDGTTMVANTEPLRIGRRSASSTLNGFHGRIDEVYLNNSANPTMIAVSDLRARRRGPLTQIEWTSPTTLNLLGFDVFRGIAGRDIWSRLTRDPLPADGPPMQPQQFSFADRQPGRNPSYKVDAVYLDGQRRSYPVPIAKPEG